MLNLLFGLNGRINRTKWWLVSGSIFALGQLYSLYLRSFIGTDGKPTEALRESLAVLLPTMVLAGLVSLVCVWIQFAVDVKRYHDRGKSFWWPLTLRAPLLLFVLLIFSMIGSLATIKPDIEKSAAVGMLAGYGLGAIGCVLLILVSSIWLIIECGFCSGEIDDNEYGPADGMNIADDLMALSGGKPAVATPETTSYRSGPAGFSNMPAATPRPLLQTNGRPAFGKRG